MKTRHKTDDWEVYDDGYFDANPKLYVMNHLPIFPVGGFDKVTHTSNGFAIHSSKVMTICWKVSDGNLDVKSISG